MTEADTLLASIAQAQRRKFLQTNTFVKNFTSLDVSPKGSSGSAYFTKGDPTTGAHGNGFKITLGTDTTFSGGEATAERVASSSDAAATATGLQYSYTLSRYYQNDNVQCTAGNDAGGELCADFCGVDREIRARGTCCNDGGETCAAPDPMSGPAGGGAGD